MDTMVLQVRRSLVFLAEQYPRIRWAAPGRGLVWESGWGCKQGLQLDKGFGTLVQALGSACGHNPVTAQGSS